MILNKSLFKDYYNRMSCSSRGVGQQGHFYILGIAINLKRMLKLAQA